MGICKCAREGLDALCEVCGGEEGGCFGDQAGGVATSHEESDR